MVLKLNVENFIKLQNEKKLNMTEMSEKLCISRSHLWRVLNKQCNPGEQFIAGFKRAFPNESLDDFFLINMLQQSDSKAI